MKSINGISFAKRSDHAICHITDLTEDMKGLLRD